jgi:hypothetical protein
MAISRMQQPRQQYGLGSFVKKAVKGVTGAVKKIAKSPLGLAAIIGGLGMYAGGLGFRIRKFYVWWLQKVQVF